MNLDRARFEAALARATSELLAARAPAGHWEGELSSSALSTATAVTALAVVERESAVQSSRFEVQGSRFKAQSNAGLAWLARHANADGGWGDTVLSLSNLSTTTLCWAAFGAVPAAGEDFRPVVTRGEDWLRQHAGGLAPEQLAPAIIRRYGKDRTFSAPILTMCALAGRLGQGTGAWQHVLPLPFELAACPHWWFAALRLPVVSYALPALIAIGQARHHHAPSPNPLARLARVLTREHTLRVLDRIQPRNGGFLEATPLTSFVTMSLAGSGQVDHPVVKRGVEFLRASQRPDGSWPIDTNLATWLTTLAVNAMAGRMGGTPVCRSCDREVAGTRIDMNGAEYVSPRPHGRSYGRQDAGETPVLRWLLAQQHQVEHPYTHAAPGGWAWTDLPGGVPDADDTAGAVLALAQLRIADCGLRIGEVRAAAFGGIKWLLDLQNRDGGIPTFCRGWGALPFDRSSADITAHAIRAWLAWLADLPDALRARTHAALRRAVGFLTRSQRPDGSWAPLWFGNQFAPDETNLTYGTARVLRALAALIARAELGRLAETALCDTAVSWLLNAQNADGGWGGAPGVGSSVEETALAIEALAAACRANVPHASSALARGIEWLVERVENGQWTRPAPIGFYFARLWYYERLYPLIFTVGALQRAARVCLP